MVDRTYEAIERELSSIVRLGERVHVYAVSGSDRRLDRASFRLLRQLVEKGPMRLSCLAECAGVDASTVSRQVAALESDGLAVREPDPDDRRAALVHASEEGTALLREIGAARRGQLRELLAAWPAEDRRELARLLGQLNSEAQRLLTPAGDSGTSNVGMKAGLMEKTR